MPKGWKPVDSKEKLDKITDKIKEEKEEIIEQKKDSRNRRTKK